MTIYHLPILVVLIAAAYLTVELVIDLWRDQ